MAHLFRTPNKDAILRRGASVAGTSSAQNFGGDEILEVGKSFQAGGTSVSAIQRAIIKFDITDYSASQADESIGEDVKYYLNLYDAGSFELTRDNNNIEVVKDFRYLGAHLCSNSSVRSPTICKRWDKALQQLKRLKHCPATVGAKANAIAAKIYAAAFYGIEAADIPIAKVKHITAAVIDVFRFRNDIHNADWFFTAFLIFPFDIPLGLSTESLITELLEDPSSLVRVTSQLFAKKVTLPSCISWCFAAAFIPLTIFSLVFASHDGL